MQHHVVYGEEESPAFLIVELPVFEVPVMHEETFYPVPQNGTSGSVTPLDLALYKQKISTGNVPAQFHPLQTIPFLDYENENYNPVEDKYRTLAHDLLRGLVDPALKPDRVQRDRLAAIIASPSHHPTREEKGKQELALEVDFFFLFCFLAYTLLSRSSLAISLQSCGQSPCLDEVFTCSRLDSRKRSSSSSGTARTVEKTKSNRSD